MSDTSNKQSSVTRELDLFQQRFMTLYRDRYQSDPVIEFDHEWVSPCEKGEPDTDNQVCWHPVAINDELSFASMEQALKLELHPDLKSYFASSYSDNLPAKCADGQLELLLPWNRRDFDRLQENLIGHIMMKRKLRQAITIFFAVTDDDEIILSVMNDTGEVWAERVGKEPHRKIADNLAEFIAGLDPVVK
ncbi:SecY-interacting protein [Spongorhabdus nitratireducens]